MGQHDYYPLYGSSGNLHNNVWHAHHNALTVIAFLSIPKSKWLVTYNTSSTADQDTSWLRVQGWSKIPKIPLPSVPLINAGNSWATASRNDHSRSDLLPWWSLLVYHLWSWAVHHWLPGASYDCLYCPGVVPMVCHWLFMGNSLSLPQMYCLPKWSWQSLWAAGPWADTAFNGYFWLQDALGWSWHY